MAAEPSEGSAAEERASLEPLRSRFVATLEEELDRAIPQQRGTEFFWHGQSLRLAAVGQPPWARVPPVRVHDAALVISASLGASYNHPISHGHVIRPTGIASAEAFGTPTVVGSLQAVLITASAADVRLQRRMSREAYVGTLMGAGGMLGSAFGTVGIFACAAFAGAIALYRSRPLQD